jgi:hypothetical protein
MRVLVFFSSAGLERGRVDIAHFPLRSNSVSEACAQLWSIRRAWRLKEIWLAGMGDDLVRITHGKEEEKDERRKAAGT